MGAFGVVSVAFSFAQNSRTQAPRQRPRHSPPAGRRTQMPLIYSSIKQDGAEGVLGERSSRPSADAALIPRRQGPGPRPLSVLAPPLIRTGR